MVNFWRGKRVFITGHTGFKGSWLSLWLQELQAEVIGFALAPPTPVNLFNESSVAEHMIDIRGDVRDFTELNKAIVRHQPEIIFHLAAQPLVHYSYLHPVETYSTNVMGTVHVLEAARHCSSVRAIVNVTTDKCYENTETHVGYRETDRMGGYDPYSNSKGCSELVTSAYRNSFFNLKNKVGLASARAGNVIGGGDWAQDRLVPDIISACVIGKPSQIRNPHAIRPWQHVLESIQGYLRLGQLLYETPESYSEAWNFGPNNSDDRSVGWMVNEILKQWGNHLTWDHAKNDLPPETNYLRLDSSKAIKKLGWFPKWDIHHALQTTINWYKSYYDGKNPKIITLEQINEYRLAEEIII